MNRLDRRALTSTLLSGVFLGLAGTGLYAYATPYSATISGIHTLLGAAVVIAFGFHLSNNLKGLLGYFGKRRRIAFAIGLPATLALLVLLGLPPASTVIDTGYALRNMGGVTDATSRSSAPASAATRAFPCACPCAPGATTNPIRSRSSSA